MAHLDLDELPPLRDPVMIVSFTGWNDAGEAATAAVRWLVRHRSSRRVGRFDPEEFQVFTDTRPTVKLVNGERRLSWPAHDLYLVSGEEQARDLLLLVAREPELRWRTYCRLLIDVAKSNGVETVASLGALLADAPHSRPVPISGFATTSAWWSRLSARDVSASGYEGPTGIVGVFHDFCRQADLPSFSLWAAVPHYLPTTANPKAALALLRQVDVLLELRLDLTLLENAASYFERRVNDAVSRDRRAIGYLRELERRAEASTTESGAETPTPLPSAEDVIRDLEDFLRGRSSEGGS